MANVKELRPQSVRQQVTAEEWEARVNLAAAYRLIAHFGWDDLIFTHISMRVPGPENHFLINPFGLMFNEITASSLLKVDLDGNLVLESEYPFNNAGFVIHSAIHAGRADAHCVMHLHTLPGQAVSAQRDGLQPLSQTAMLLTGDIAYHDYEGPAQDVDERARLVADLGDKNLMILRNHGTLTVGPRVQDAFIRMYYLERACAVQVMALSGAAAINHPPAGTPEKSGAMGRKGFSEGRGGDMVWPAMIRLLDAKDPSYGD